MTDVFIPSAYPLTIPDRALEHPSPDLIQPEFTTPFQRFLSLLTERSPALLPRGTPINQILASGLWVVAASVAKKIGRSIGTREHFLGDLSRRVNRVVNAGLAIRFDDMTAAVDDFITAAIQPVFDRLQTEPGIATTMQELWQMPVAKWFAECMKEAARIGGEIESFLTWNPFTIMGAYLPHGDPLSRRDQCFLSVMYSDEEAQEEARRTIIKSWPAPKEGVIGVVGVRGGIATSPFSNRQIYFACELYRHIRRWLSTSQTFEAVPPGTGRKANRTKVRVTLTPPSSLETLCLQTKILLSGLPGLKGTAIPASEYLIALHVVEKTLIEKLIPRCTYRHGPIKGYSHRTREVEEGSPAERFFALIERVKRWNDDPANPKYPAVFIKET